MILDNVIYIIEVNSFGVQRPYIILWPMYIMKWKPTFH